MVEGRLLMYKEISALQLMNALFSALIFVNAPISMLLNFGQFMNAPANPTDNELVVVGIATAVSAGQPENTELMLLILVSLLISTPGNFEQFWNTRSSEKAPVCPAEGNATLSRAVKF